MADYNEIICTAIDTIVSSKLEGLQFDITKLCLIEDDSQSAKGKYIVSDGSVRYEAYSTDGTLKKGNNVQVVIPNGDYNKQKTIIGKVVAADTTPFKYTSPLDTMIKITDNIFAGAPSISLLANDKIEIDGVLHNNTAKQIYHLTDSTNFAGFTRLGISADFSSLLMDQDVVSGTYGISVFVYADGGAKPYQFDFTTKDMYGNPYAFEGYFSQEKVFPIDGINKIESIDVYFFQNGDFKNSHGELIPYLESPLYAGQPADELIKLEDNLFVDNIQVYLGYDSKEFTDETLKIFAKDSLTFKYDNDIIFRNMGLRWVHKKEDGLFEILNDDDDIKLGPDDQGEFEIIWYQYDELLKDQEDQYAGFGWKKIQSKAEENLSMVDKADGEIYSSFECRAYLNHLNQREQFKVIGIWYENFGQEDISDIGKKVFTSNILTFTNEIKQADQTTKNATSALQIICDDGSEGNYFVYDQNGKIINEADGSSRERIFKLEFKGMEIDNALGALDYVKWWLPIDNSMVVQTEEWNKKAGAELEEEIGLGGVKYQTITRYPSADGNLSSAIQSFAIKSQWYQQLANNTIKCVLSIDGVEYEAIEQMNFGKAGTNGSNLTFFLQFDGGQNAMPAIKDIELTITAELHDGSGRNIGLTKTDEIIWSWYKLPDEHKKTIEAWKDAETDLSFEEWYNGRGTDFEHPYMTILEKTGAQTKLKYHLDDNIVPEDNYYILQAEFKSYKSEEEEKKYSLFAYLPIPIKKSKYAQIEGAREVIYNSQGIPSYYTGAYALKYKTGSPLDSIDNSMIEKDFQFTEDQIKAIAGFKSDINIKDYLDETNKVLEQYVENVTAIIREMDDTANYLEEKCDWVIHYNEEFSNKSNQLTTGYIPSLRDLNNNQKGLCASSFYMKGYNDQVCVCAGRLNDEKEFVDVYWCQPILIMQSQYDFSMLNQWDGKLTIDEKNGTIMSKMLGAGKKNSDNTTSCVLIGDIQGGTANTTSADSNVGVYGMHKGLWSFGLKEDGTAFFGQAGRGQIRLDGNYSTIQSAAYEEKQGAGMKIDLDDGIFHVTVNEDDRIYLSPGYYTDEYGIFHSAPYFQITSENKDQDNNNYNLIYMDADEYYLRSDKYEENGLQTGMEINLADGIFETKLDGKGSVIIQPKDPYFQVHKGTSKINKKTLISMGDTSGYFLQSADYLAHDNSPAENTQGEVVFSYQDDIITNSIYISFNDSDNCWYENTLTTNDTKQKIYNRTTNKHPYYSRAVADTDKDYIAAEKNWQSEREENEESTEITSVVKANLKTQVKNARIKNIESLSTIVKTDIGSGVMIDLNSGMINGYGLYLRTSKVDSPQSKYILLDGGATDYPFVIGTNLKSDWDGRLTCNNFYYLGYGPSQSHPTEGDENEAVAINVNDLFYVKKAGGGKWINGWVSQAGYASRAGTADKAKTLEGYNLASIQATIDSIKYTFNNHTHNKEGSGSSTGTPNIKM